MMMSNTPAPLRLFSSVGALLAASLILGGCGDAPAGKAPTVEEAERFIAETEDMLMELATREARAYWVQANFITDDTEAIAAQASQERMDANIKLAGDVKRFDGMELPPELARKFQLLKLSLFSLGDPKEREEIATLSTGLEGDYGKGRACFDEGPRKGECLEIGEVERIFAYGRDPEELRAAWKAWHDGVGAPMRERYTRFIQLQNKGARELGFKDMGAMWRSNYDMAPEEFSAEVERLWEQVRPFYESLHAYIRTRLVKQYGDRAVTDEGLIRADLLGNIWAQEWSYAYPLAAPPGAGRGYDLTAILRQKKVDELGMVRFGENFFKSLGFDPLPQSFWDRSLFVKPRDREVVCHASAWDMDSKGDLRLKMCIQVDAEDFVTIHHELGHNFYQRAYHGQPFLFQEGANDGFHEAIGDTIALSITPDYLKRVGLLPGGVQSDDTGRLLRQAMDKIAFLPFGLMIDQWRWKVMDGSYPAGRYNSGWWELREKYQGVAPPVARTEKDFDPGAKYHVPANVPYTRYFLAHILQFQFYRALAREAGCTGPLHDCSFYDDKAAGAKLRAMLELGRSKPWPDALEAMTGERRMDGSAVMEYFAPLKEWLDAQNAAAGAKPGWTLPKDPLAPSLR
ncbi:MAG: M2 family metallopeptidase [Acidobacteriota bacterium]|jgi:peptidyl-dipeptidase A|nr:M2 family metallopeptidase [Acidobacteriota bacterium]